MFGWWLLDHRSSNQESDIWLIGMIVGITASLGLAGIWLKGF
jgi:hypothetical protein